MMAFLLAINAKCMCRSLAFERLWHLHIVCALNVNSKNSSLKECPKG